MNLTEMLQQGFIPGPNESDDEFFERVACTKEKFQKGSWLPESHWHFARESLDAIFNVKPLYICAYYSNRNLAPWQAAASWINGKSLDRIQLRTKFKKGSFLGYSRDEILAHEAVHAMRSGFTYSRFEEFFAYMTSTRKWRRILGPIVQKPWEVWPLLLFSLCSLFSPIFYFFISLWLSVGFARLVRMHWILRIVGNRLNAIVQDACKARAVMLCLSDAEIMTFYKKNNIVPFVLSQNCLRWQMIKKGYMNGTESHS